MRKTWIVLALLLAVAGGVMLMARRTGSDWTTDSPAALAEFERGLDAQMKYYGGDASDSYRKALEIDPEFVAAKLSLWRYERDPERKKKLIDELRAVNLDRLNPRERFLLSYALAREDGRDQEAERLVEQYLERYPKDPYALSVCSAQAWDERDWERAERHYRHLLEVDPNWVSAQNHLGYMAMAQGRFQEAEQLFETYNFIAPDQANPHDSMGELLTVLGRYEEARRALERALEFKPDFCPSYEHLFSLVTLAGQTEEFPTIVERARQHCGERMAETMACVAELWTDYLERDYEAPWGEDRDECRKQYAHEYFLLHRLALLSGRLEAAHDLEEVVRKRSEKREGFNSDLERALLLHMSGVRQLATGEAAAAAESLAEADKLLLYWGQGAAILKMFNQMNLAAALETAGEETRAEQVLEQVRRVNSDFAAYYPEIRAEFAGA